MAKEFIFRGLRTEQIKKLSLKEFAALLPARQRRTIERGFTEAEKTLLKRIAAGDKEIKTHCRDMIVLPSMIGLMLKIHNGKEFPLIKIEEDMIGHRLGEFTATRKKIMHSAPGIGATRSSASLSVR
jgi:small subunit ribosomal protein S19